MVSTRAAWVAIAFLPTAVLASSTLVSELEQRLGRDGGEVVNAYLIARPSAMAELNQSAADCHPQAVELTVRLSRGANAKAAALHKESLRIAAGGCAEFVLSQLDLAEVPKICASASSWTVSQTARELRRRLREIESDETLRKAPSGKACHAAYLFELQNTRVGLRAGPPNNPAR